MEVGEELELAVVQDFETTVDLPINDYRQGFHVATTKGTVSAKPPSYGDYERKESCFNKGKKQTGRQAGMYPHWIIGRRVPENGVLEYKIMTAAQSGNVAEWVSAVELHNRSESGKFVFQQAMTQFAIDRYV
jgi:hypothetical protein